MVEGLADDRQVGSASCHPSTESATQVVKPHVFDTRFLANGFPCSLGFDQMAFGPGAGEHERTVDGVGVCLAFSEDFQRLRQQGDDLRLAVLGLRDRPFLPHEADLIPAHSQHVGATCARDQAHLDVVAGHGILAFVHSLEERRKLFTS